jgi:hypothetical protein
MFIPSETRTLSQDVYKADRHRHGGGHVDRYRGNKNIGRYRKDRTPILHMGKSPLPVPQSDWTRFDAEAAEL